LLLLSPVAGKEDSTGNMARARRKQTSFSNILFLIVSFVFIEFETMESINDGDVVIVDHDLENEETQITDTPEKSTRKKTTSLVKSSISRALVHIISKSWHIGKGI
jgi:hypothetical protein